MRGQMMIKIAEVKLKMKKIVTRENRENIDDSMGGKKIGKKVEKHKNFLMERKNKSKFWKIFQLSVMENFFYEPQLPSIFLG